MGKCLHDINKEGNSLEIVKRRILVYPEQVDCFCPLCKKTFRFRKDDEGKYHKILKRTKEKITEEEENKK